MAWTYAEDLEVPLNFVRYKIGDTTQKPESPSDEIITYWLGQYDGDRYRAAAEVARHLSQQYAAKAKTSGSAVKIGGMSLSNRDESFQQQADRFADLADELDGGAQHRSGRIGMAVPATVSQFSIGMMDNPR